MDDTQSYLDVAFEEPWLFVCLVMFFAIYKVCKFLSFKLFDDESGILSNYVKKLESGTQAMQDRIGDAFESIRDHSDKIDRVEISIISKIDDSRKEIIQHIKRDE